MPDLLNSLFSVDKYDYDITKKGFIRKRKDYKSGLKQYKLSEGNPRETWHHNGKEGGVPPEYGVIHSRNGSIEPTRRMEDRGRREPRSGINPEHPSSASQRSRRTSHIPHSQGNHHTFTSARPDKGMHHSEMGGNHQPPESRVSQRPQYHKQQPGPNMHRSRMY